MNVMKLLRISAIVLLMLTVIDVVLVVDAFSPTPLPFPDYSGEWCVAYQANEISKPLLGDYWNLTDPDAYILEAIALSSVPEIYDPETRTTWEHWTYAKTNETTFIYQVYYEHGELWNIEYDEHYYCVDCICHWDLDYVTPELYVLHRERHRTDVTTAAAILGASWIGLGVVWVTKKPKPQ